MKFLLALLLLVPTFAMAEDSVFVVLRFQGGSQNYLNFAKLKITKSIFETKSETGISLICRSKVDPQKHQFRLIDGDISYVVRPKDSHRSGVTVASTFKSLQNIETSMDYREPGEIAFVLGIIGEANYKGYLDSNPELLPLENLSEILPSKKSKIISYDSFFCLFAQNGEYIDPPVTP